MKSDKNVPRILSMDGVGQFLNPDEDQKNFQNIYKIIERLPTMRSWAYKLVDSKSNSMTLISQMPGEGNRFHSHPDWDEVWIIYEGKWYIQFSDGENCRYVTDGDIVFVERGRTHKITCVGTDRAVRLAISRYDVAHVYTEEDY